MKQDLNEFEFLRNYIAQRAQDYLNISDTHREKGDTDRTVKAFLDGFPGVNVSQRRELYQSYLDLTGRMPRILAMDDTPSVLTCYEAIFEGIAKLRTAPTLRQGLDKFLEHPDLYHAVLTDLTPSKDDLSLTGNDVYRAAKQYNPNIPVFIVTGNIEGGLLEEAKSLDANCIIHKAPLDVSSLKTKVLEAAKQYREQRDS